MERSRPDSGTVRHVLQRLPVLRRRVEHGVSEQNYFCSQVQDTAAKILTLERRCYCSNSLARSTQKKSDILCDSVCSADYSEACGGRGMLSLYEKGIDVSNAG